MCRADQPVTEDILNKISMFCNIPVENAIPNLTAPILYEVPLMLEKEGLGNVVCKHLKLNVPEPDLTEWTQMVERAKATVDGEVEIALVGKYVALHDAYLSVAEALRHAGCALGADVDIQWIDSETITESNAGEILGALDGIIVPGGFGQRFAPPKDAVAAGDGFGTAQSDDGAGSARSGGGSDDGIGRCVHRTKIIGGSGS